MIKRHQRNNSQLLSFYILALFSIVSHFCTLGEFLENPSIHLELERIKQRTSNEIMSSGEKVGSATTTRVHCRKQVACVISLPRSRCILHVCGSLFIFLSLAWDFPRLTVASTLPCHFLDSHDVVDSLFD